MKISALIILFLFVLLVGCSTKVDTNPVSNDEEVRATLPTLYPNLSPSEDEVVRRSRTPSFYSNLSPREEETIIREKMIKINPPFINIAVHSVDNYVLTLVINNNTNDEFLYGAHFHLFVNNNGHWESIPIRPDLEFHLLEYVLPAQSSVTVSKDIGWFYGGLESASYLHEILEEGGSVNIYIRLESGLYKIQKNVSLRDTTTNDRRDFIIEKEFTIP